MFPRWLKCSLARIGCVQVFPSSSDCTIHRLQSPLTKSGPPQLLQVAGVPYQATSSRPGSPAAIQAKTLLFSPGVGICCGADHVLPSSVDVENIRAESPITLPEPSTGACSQTA